VFGASICNRQVRDDAVVRAAVGKELGKGSGQGMRQRDKRPWSVRLQICREWEPTDAMKAEIKRTDGGKSGGRNIQDSAVDVHGIHEWDEHRDVRGHAETGGCVIPEPHLANAGLGFRYSDDEGAYCH
jgi:hypothetical protein